MADARHFVVIGANAAVKENVTMGAWSVVGCGAAVINDVPAYERCVGVPAR